MLIKNIFFLISFFMFFILKNYAENSNTFVVFGHGYSTLLNKKKREDFIKKINKMNPKLVFILGDSELDNNDIVLDYKSKLKAKVFFSPGNNEIKKGNLDKYLDNVGYLDTLLKTEFGNFILLNSLASSESINLYLKNIINNLDTLVPTFLLTHHRIWDDNLISPYPYEHDKSYLFSDLDSNIISSFNYIIAGNSPTQYFGHINTEIPYNTNICYWLDMVKNIECYSMGMKNTPFFHFLKVFDREIVIKSIVNKKSKLISKQKLIKDKEINKKIIYPIEHFLYLFICILILIIIKMRKNLK